ncbi:hypothetical protein WCP94_001576 [Bilophila wadsworthia]
MPFRQNQQCDAVRGTPGRSGRCRVCMAASRIFVYGVTGGTPNGKSPVLRSFAKGTTRRRTGGLKT